MIASAVGGIPEIFGDGSPAMVQPDPAELAVKMTEALADPAAFKALMPTESELRARFGADVMAGQIEAAYRSALGGRA
jgi:glycosyltransferase involved in cell wall biosynthesis